MEPHQGNRLHEHHRSPTPRRHYLHQLPTLQREGCHHRQWGELIQKDRVWQISGDLQDPFPHQNRRSQEQGSHP